MTDEDLKSLTLSMAVRMIAEKRLSADELIAATRSRIERLNPEMRAFITVMDRAADFRAERAFARRPHFCERSLRHKGRPNDCRLESVREPHSRSGCDGRNEAEGSRRDHHRQDQLARICFRHHHDKPSLRNRAKPVGSRHRISGGSSGGSASATALSLGLASLGSDTGGSIRIPAALCGIVGLKPTYGRVSLRGVVPLAWSLDHPGPMTRTVEDAALLMEMIAGYDPGDPHSANVEVPRYTDALNGNIKGVRVGIPVNYFYDQLSPSVDQAIHAAIRQLENLGAKTVDIEMPGIPIHRACWFHIASPEAYSYHEFHLQKHADLYGADVRGRLEAGRVLLSIDYVRAQRARTAIKKDFNQLFDAVDVVVTPTVPIPAPRIEDVHQPWGDGPETAAASVTRFTRYFNVAGVPTISIPCGFSPEGLPIGMQIAGKAFDEFTVLRVAHAYEQSARWFERRPEM